MDRKERKKLLEQSQAAYPFMEQKKENMWCKWLAPELENQMKDLFSTLRYPNIIISEQVEKAQLAISIIFHRRNCIFFPAENYTYVQCKKKSRCEQYKSQQWEITIDH